MDVRGDARGEAEDEQVRGHEVVRGEVSGNIDIENPLISRREAEICDSVD